MSNGESSSMTIGAALRCRLQESKVSHFFTVPGDLTMPLLDELLGESGNGLQLVGCANELNAGYAADGYGRLAGPFGVLVVTYMVGAYSALNAVAGSFAENIPMLVVVGSPNSNDEAEHKNTHHTLGDKSLNHCFETFKTVCGASFKIKNPTGAQGEIDKAITACLNSNKPVYLEIPCNFVKMEISPPPMMGCWKGLRQYKSDEQSLHQALETVTNLINGASSVTIIVGSRLHQFDCEEDLYSLIEALECPVVTMPDAKGLIDEYHPQFGGVYWGKISSSEQVQELVEKRSDIKLFIGCNFTDYNTVGWNVHFRDEKSVIININHVHTYQKRFTNVKLKDVLQSLKGSVKGKGQKECDLIGNRKFCGADCSVDYNPNEPIKTSTVVPIIQDALKPAVYKAVIAETGDSWFLSQKLRLSRSQKFFIQMQSVGRYLAA